ncbi:hypothetical protein D9611_009378 [Ephemerocybe angulata]|uniref:Uncharacterized protein n=1 Tax=Ephemerocybe angulata TaxID=980116 RepID=A0A8H5BGZ7_9AGAR|nr:hypothetical protein D9611_009378 [Tulosesus angulatus]
MNKRAIAVMVALAGSIFTSSRVIWAVLSTDHPSPAGVIGAVLALLTLPHNLTVLVLALKQRKRLYTPDDMLDFVPVTATFKVMWSSIFLGFAWVILANFYGIKELLGAPWHNVDYSPAAEYFHSTAEFLFLYAIVGLCYLDRFCSTEREDRRSKSDVDSERDGGKMEGA